MFVLTLRSNEHGFEFSSRIQINHHKAMQLSAISTFYSSLHDQT